MSFKFNPTTSQLDLVGSSAAAADVTAIDLTFVANETISALKVVYAVSETDVGVCDSDVLAKSQALGVALNAATIGQPVAVRTFGLLEDVSFLFLPGDELFVSSNGSITDNPVSTGFHIEIGHSLGTGKIFVQVRRPITL